MKQLGLFVLALFAVAVAWHLTATIHLPPALAFAHATGVHHVLHAGVALELLNGFVTAPGATYTAWTMATGDSLTIRNVTDPTKRIALVSMWGVQQGDGNIRITSPRMHDNVVGYHPKVVAAQAAASFPRGLWQRLYPQDTLSVAQTGSATAGKIEQGSLLVYYEDLPGVSARFISSDDLMKRGVNIMTVTSSLALGTAGGYSGGVAINATDDQFKANTDYALVGYVVDALAGCVAWRGADTGNLRVGGPSDKTRPDVTSWWFKALSEAQGIPLIPVFNSANKQGITVDGTQDENGADVVVSSIFVQLAPAA